MKTNFSHCSDKNNIIQSLKKPLKTENKTDLNDNFWDDCLENNNKIKKSLYNSIYKKGFKEQRQISLFGNTSDDNIMKEYKNAIMSKSRNVIENHLKQALSLPMNNSKKTEFKSKATFEKQKPNKTTMRVNSQERCFQLYEKGKIKNEYTRLSQHNPNKIKEESELKECTFKPQVNRTMNRKLSVGNMEGGFYERTVNWKKMNQEKIEIEKIEKKKNEDKLSFMPQVNVPNKMLFDPKKNISTKDNKTIKKFMNRLVNARNEEHKKKELLNNLGRINVLKNTTNKTNSNEMIQKSFNVDMRYDDAMKNLRNELHSMKFYDDE